VLERDRERTADNIYGIYHAPLGQDQHLVRMPCNDQPFRVGSLFPGRTFSPGSVVMMVSNTGHPGLSIAGGPPVGRRGASLVGPPLSLRVTPFGVAAPLSEFGTWLAVAVIGSELVALRYDGPIFAEEVARIADPGIGSVQSVALISWSPLAYAIGGFHSCSVWNITANTMSTPVTYPWSTGDEGDIMAAPSQSRGLLRVSTDPGSTEFFAMWEISASGVLTKLTADGEESLPEPLEGSSGTPGFSFFTGAEALHPVSGDPGQAGYVTWGAEPPVFTPSDDWLPGDPTSGEWLSWQNGHLMGSVALAAQTSFSPDVRVATVDSAAVYTELIGAAHGLSALSAWPFPSGARFGIVDFSGAPRAARLSATPLADPPVGVIPWFTIEGHGDFDPTSALFNFFPIAD